MDEEEVLKQLAAERVSLDDTAKYVSALFLTFLLASVYIAIAVGSTNDEQLLRESNLPLPLLGVGLAVKAFYVVVPIAFVLLHLYLLLHIYFLSRKAFDFDAKMTGLFDTTQHEAQRRLLFPLIISPLTIKAYPSLTIRSLLHAVIWVTVIGGPMLLLIFTQIRFLPYHSVPITMWHRVCLLMDVAIIWLIWWRISKGSTAKESSKPELVSQGVPIFLAAASTVVMVVVSLFLAVVPSEAWDWNWRGFQAVKNLLHRDLDLKDRTLVAESPSPELIAFYLQQGKKVEEAWTKHAKGISLRGRDLRGANFSFSRLYNADLRGANLDYAVFNGTILNGAKLEKEETGKAWTDEATKLGPTKLRGAEFVYARMENINLAEADLQGATLFAADLRGANCYGTKLQGTILERAQMQGAHLENANLQASWASETSLQGANLEAAELQGAYLQGAQFQGANLKRAKLQGAKFDEANLQGTTLEDADLSGASFRNADFTLSNLTHALSAHFSKEDVVKLKNLLKSLENFVTNRPANLRPAQLCNVQEADRPTSFDSARHLDESLFDEGSSMFRPEQLFPCDREDYYAKWMSFLVELGCNDRWVANTLVDRATLWMEPSKESFAEVVGLAKALLEARAGKCSALSEISDERWKWLEDGVTQYANKTSQETNN